MYHILWDISRTLQYGKFLLVWRKKSCSKWQLLFHLVGCVYLKDQFGCFLRQQKFCSMKHWPLKHVTPPPVRELVSIWWVFFRLWQLRSLNQMLYIDRFIQSVRDSCSSRIISADWWRSTLFWQAWVVLPQKYATGSFDITVDSSEIKQTN